MPIIKLCGFCTYYEKVEGLFGDCKEPKRNEKHEVTTFSSNVACGAFVLNPKSKEVAKGPGFADFGTLRNFVDPRILEFMGMAMPPGFMERQECPPGCACQENEQEPKADTWINPIVRRVKSKHKPRKVINIADVLAERSNKV